MTKCQPLRWSLLNPPQSESRNINQNRRVSQLTVFGVVFMPINILAGMGGMSEFSMMTRTVPWPLSYALFTIGMFVVAWLTYIILRYYEKPRKIRRTS